MPSSTAPSNDVAYSVDDLIAEASRWGYRTAMQDSGADGQALLAFGQMTSIDLSSGLRACFTSLAAHRTHERGGILQRSLSIRLVTSQSDEYRLSPDRIHALSQGGCLVLDAADDLYISSQQYEGQIVGGLFMDACPDRIADEELAERVNRRLYGTRVAPLAVPARLCTFAAAISRTALLDPILKLRVESCALELLACALEQDDARTDVHLSLGDRKRVKQVRDYILTAPAADHSLSELARLAGMSPSTLKRKFPIETGQSVFEFIRDARLEQARISIMTGEATIKQAAWTAGYAHASNFSAAYRKKFGHSPRRIAG